MTALAMLACSSNEPNVEEGAFSVSKSQKVYFSPGNLQYQASTNTWRFAANQYDTIGALNCNVSDKYEGWIDTYAWGTGNNPTATSLNDKDYDKFSDWGNNAISNGGNKTYQWRVLTHKEWKYLLDERRSAAELKGLGTVNGVHGCILLPDNWSSSDKYSFIPEQRDYSRNIYSVGEWEKMEEDGAVFLPASGWRFGTEITHVNEYGLYWTSTPDDKTDAYGFYFDAEDEGIYNNYVFPRRFCMTVRLVQDN